MLFPVLGLVFAVFLLGYAAYAASKKKWLNLAIAVLIAGGLIYVSVPAAIAAANGQPAPTLKSPIELPTVGNPAQGVQPTAIAAAPSIPTAIPQSNPATGGPLFGLTVADADTDVEMSAAFGFKKLGIAPVATFVDWDPNKWNWQSNSVGFKGITLKIPYGWSANLTTSNGKYPMVYIGLEPGKTVDVDNVIGFTLRKLTNYPLANPWRVSAQKHFNQEWDYGMNPKFHGTEVYPTCPGNIQVELTPEQAKACK